LTIWWSRIASCGSAESRRATGPREADGGPREGDGGDPPARSYEAVAIRSHRCACKAARQLAGVCFLVAEAPKLPLESCTLFCRCTYKSYPDRRRDARRLADVGVTSTHYMGAERRSALNRRISQHEGGSGDYYDFMRRRSGDS
jgi:hypothetical protein